MFAKKSMQIIMNRKQLFYISNDRKWEDTYLNNVKKNIGKSHNMYVEHSNQAFQYL